MRRQSIHVTGFAHKNPVPAACRIGHLVVSGGIHGIDPATGEIPAGLERQCALMWDHVGRIVAEAGASPDDIIKMNFWMNDKSYRPAINVGWLKLFPDEKSRPARHAMERAMEGGMLVQCDFMAVLKG